MATTFINDDRLVAVSEDDLSSLRAAAEASPLRRARYCLHRDHAAAIQAMLIGVLRDSYIRPHRQPGMRKYYTAIKGSARLVFLDDQGGIVEVRALAASGAKVPFFCAFAADAWHTLLPDCDFLVYVETIPGPFTPTRTDWATFAADGSEDAAAHAYLEGLRRETDRLLAGAEPARATGG